MIGWVRGVNYLLWYRVIELIVDFKTLFVFLLIEGRDMYPRPLWLGNSYILIIQSKYTYIETSFP